MIEEWRSTHHPDYDVSNMGRVRSWTNRGKRARIGRQPIPRILRPGSCRGHLRVHLGANNGYYVHRLVATAFLGPCPDGKECMHADDDRGNNCLSNLSWGTRRQNIDDMIQRNRYWSKARLAYRERRRA